MVLEKRFYDDGTVLWEGEVVDGCLHGFSKYYFLDGTLSSSCLYRKGKKDGKEFFYRKEGGITCLKQYHEGYLHGVQEYYFANGNIKTKLYYDKGFLAGVEQYYENGAPQRKVEMKQGKRHGFDRFFEEGGAVRFAIKYMMGKLIDDSNCCEKT